MKWAIIVATLLLSTSANAERRHRPSGIRWGVELSGLYATNGVGDFDKDRSSTLSFLGPNYQTSGKQTPSSFGGVVSLSAEGRTPFRVGASIGFGYSDGPSYKVFRTDTGPHWSGTYTQLYDFSLNARTLFVPLDLFVKYRPRGKAISFFAAAGADYTDVSINGHFISDYTDTSANDSHHDLQGTFTDERKFIPHLKAGLEWSLSRWFAVTLGVRYTSRVKFSNLEGRVTKDGHNDGDYRLMMLEGAPSDVMLLPVKPSDPTANFCRNFIYDPSGIQYTLGVKIKFR